VTSNTSVEGTIRHSRRDRQVKQMSIDGNSSNAIYTNLQSKVCRGGKEEATQSYSTIRRGADDDANKGRRMNANWYQLIEGIVSVKIRRQFDVVNFLNKDIIKT
jgi:hypothetical protein